MAEPSTEGFLTEFDVHVFNTAGNPADMEFSPSPSARPKLRGL
jgi:hypothetical protein